MPHYANKHVPSRPHKSIIFFSDFIFPLRTHFFLLYITFLSEILLRPISYLVITPCVWRSFVHSWPLRQINPPNERNKILHCGLFLCYRSKSKCRYTTPIKTMSFVTQRLRQNVKPVTAIMLLLPQRHLLKLKKCFAISKV